MKRSLGGLPFNQTRWNIFATPEWRVVWILPPKTASTAVRKALAGALNIPATDFHQIAQFKGLTSQDAHRLKHEEGYLCVGVVRHPLERLVSCWYEKVVCEPFYSEFTVYDEFWPTMSFAEFATAVAGIPDEDAEPHFRSLSYSLEVQGQVVADVLLEQSRMEPDWAALRERIAIRLADGQALPDLTRINVTDSASKIPPPGPEVVAIVEQRYRSDYLNFNYPLTAN